MILLDCLKLKHVDFFDYKFRTRKKFIYLIFVLRSTRSVLISKSMRLPNGISFEWYFFGWEINYFLIITSIHRGSAGAHIQSSKVNNDLLLSLRFLIVNDLFDYGER